MRPPDSDSKHDITTFLLTNGVPDANLHVSATVYLMEEGEDATGYWCRLVTADEYWTSRYNKVTYDFALHIRPDGTIRLMHPKHVGPPKAATPIEGGRKPG